MGIAEKLFIINNLLIVLLLYMDRIKNIRVLSLMKVSSMGLLLLHRYFGNIRWQMYPIYLMTLIIILIDIYLIMNKEKLREGERQSLPQNVIKINMKSQKSKKKIFFRRKIFLFAIILLVITSVVSSYAFPISDIPKPNGQYDIGTRTYYIEDKGRKEIYDNDKDSIRKIAMQVWYPTYKIEGLKKAFWLDEGRIVSKGLTQMMEFPDFALSHLHMIKSNSYKDAELLEREEKFPVVVISHGWTGFRNIHTDIAELLSSNGYIVVAIDHTYGAVATRFENGEVAYLNSGALPDRESTDDFLGYANRLVNTYAKDIILTIDEIENLNSGELDNEFKDKLDLDKLGVIGHSTGGGASVKASMVDKRIKVVFGMDPWVEPFKDEYIQQGLDVPSVFLRSEQWETGLNNENLFKLINASRVQPKLYSIEGTYHTDFTMAYLFSPLTSRVNLTGPIDKVLNTEIQHEFILNFYNKHLLGIDNDTIEKIEESYSEVERVYE